MKKPISVLIIIVLCIVGLSIMRVVVSNGISTSGIALDQIQTDIAYYKIQNINVKQKLLSISSFNYVASKASSLGFGESKSIISLNKSIPLAKKP
ncbi:MAG: hypothetical protein AAB531_00480 [Patescibacteria group bacterium]